MSGDEYNEGPASAPQGWYHAEGDPVGTQRFWNGSQWVGEPQLLQDGFSPFTSTAATAGGVAALRLAQPSQRLIAFAIDYGLSIAPVPLIVLGFAFSDAVGGTLILLSILFFFGFWTWNRAIRQGSRGQSIGKAQQRVRLVADSTGQPVGVGVGFARVLIPFGALAGLWMLTFLFLGIGVFLILIDYLWPFWDRDNKRLVDKILKCRVVQA